ncbi:MAG: DUF4831 family protein [Paludibacteraceae bacterium]|nr:DUF4831 family protein [Paludibacteraceae bacterium]
MRRLFPLSLLILAVLPLLAQKNYAFRVEYDEIRTERGELYQYTDRYLGTTQVITDTGTVFVLKNVSLLQNRHPQPKSENPKKKEDAKQQLSDAEVTILPPLNEEALMAANTAKKAESVAKQIYRIREARLALVAGEAEHTPADGSAMRQALKRLDKMEEALTAMFVGKRTVKHLTKVVYFAPDTTLTALNEVLLRFSRFAGPVAADDLSGAPVRLFINFQKEALPVDKKKKDQQPAMYIKQTEIKISYEGQTIQHIPAL